MKKNRYDFKPDTLDGPIKLKSHIVVECKKCKCTRMYGTCWEFSGYKQVVCPYCDQKILSSHKI